MSSSSSALATKIASYSLVSVCDLYSATNCGTSQPLPSSIPIQTCRLRGIINGDLEALKALSQAFIDAGSDAVAQSPLGFMTAVFTQAAVANSTEEAQALFFESQKVMKKMIFTPGDLDTTLSTRWPLWGMAYLASLKTVA